MAKPVPEGREQELVREFFGGARSGFFVEVGANRPQWASQTWHLEMLGWSGVLIEPQPNLADELKRQRSAKVFAVACSTPQNAGGRLRLHVAGALSSLDRERMAPGAMPERVIEVPVRTLDDILREAQAPVSFDFLSVDVEGHELEVLGGFDLARWQPRLILLEDHVGDLAKHRFLMRAGYRLIRRCENNGWYVPGSSPATVAPGDRWEIVRKYYLALPFRIARNASRSLRRQVGRWARRLKAPYRACIHPRNFLTNSSQPSLRAQAMATISTSIIALNQAEKIADAISTVLWTDEIVLADSNSIDDTVKIAEGMGARVVQIPLTTFSELRNRAADACSSEWILSLDTDERCTPEVRDEILALLAAGPAHDAYYIPRRNYFMGRWIKGSGWYPNFRQPQLYRKGTMRYTRIIHEGVEMSTDRGIGTLKNAIWQYPFRNFEEVLHKANRYSTVGARMLADKRVTLWTALGHAIWAFIKHYVFKVGFRDGWAGFVIALGNFEGTFYRYAKRFEETQSWGPPIRQTIRRDTP